MRIEHIPTPVLLPWLRLGNDVSLVFPVQVDCLSLPPIPVHVTDTPVQTPEGKALCSIPVHPSACKGQPCASSVREVRYSTNSSSGNSRCLCHFF